MSSNTEAAAEVRVVGIWASPFVIRVCIALKLKGVQYEFLQEEVGKKSELLLKSNPVYKKIPVLIHNGKPICESMIIVQYIDEVWASAAAPRILPADPYARAVERFWAEYVDAKFPTAIRTMAGTIEGDKEAAAEQAATALQHLEEALVKCSEGSQFFGGGEIGYLDIVLGSHLGWIRAVEKITGLRFLDDAKVPRLVEWARRFCAHEAVKGVMPDADKLVEFSGVIRDMLKANASR